MMEGIQTQFKQAYLCSDYRIPPFQLCDTLSTYVIVY